MKKILVTLLALVMLCAIALPVMADESPVKSYDSAKDGDLLYAIDFSGKDGVLEFANAGGMEADKYFTFTPSADGSSMAIKGIPGSDDDNMYTGYYGAMISDLKTTPATVYTMTYKVKMNGTAGKNNSIGVGGYFPGGGTARSYHLYGNFNTVGANNDTSMRRTSLSINNGKLADYVMWNTLPAYEIDSDGYSTIMLVYDGGNAKVYAYLRAQGAGDGSKESDWIKLEECKLKVDDNWQDTYGNMGVFVYSYYVDSVDAIVKDAKIYKGNLIGSTVSVSPVAPNVAETPTPPASTADTFSALPIALMVLSGAAVAVLVSKKKD